MKTLASFVQEKREKLGLSTSGLANKCHLDLDLLQKIEGGEELFLPTTVRQKLAKGLRCSVDEIKSLEKEFSNKIVDEKTIREIKEKILREEDNILCPLCNSPLRVRIAKMYDLEDNLMLHPKAVCTKCVFQIKD